MYCFNSNADPDNSEFIKGFEGWLMLKNGSRLFDSWLGAGTLIFGHTGLTFESGMVPISSEFREEIYTLIEKLVDFKIGGIGFQTSGSSAVTRACRVSLSYNQRKKIALIQNFWHGSDDLFLYKGEGIPLSTGLSSEPNTYYESFSSIESFLECKYLEEFSALLVEPHQGSNPDCNQLEILKDKTYRDILRQKDILLICDEVITGFRECYGSCFNSRAACPDLVILGKALAGGFPIGVVLVSELVMRKIDQEGIFWGGTFSATNAQIFAMHKQLKLLRMLDYSILTDNLQLLKSKIMDSKTFSSSNVKILSGCNFGRIVSNTTESDQSSRGFNSSYDLSKFLRNMALDEQIYIARNRLIFPSIFSFGDLASSPHSLVY